MRNVYFILFFLAFSLSENVLFAQEKDQFSVKAQIRPRFEMNHGALFPMDESDKAAAFISNRTRLTLGFDNGFLSMGISAQEISTWGGKPQIDGSGSTTINEAWAKLRKDGCFLQIGRQQLAYDDDRILGTLDWSQAGRWHDAMKLGYENTNHMAHLILAYNQNSQTPNAGNFYSGGQPYKFMQTGYYLYDDKSNFKVSFLAMNLGFQGGTAEEGEVNNLQTFGANLSYKANDLSLWGTVYYQTGKNSGGKKADAYMFAAKAKYDVAPVFSPAVGVDYLSGQKAGETEKATWFNPLYGTHHKFYGAMDYFYASAYPNYGLADFYVSLIFKPGKKLTADLTYHNFSSQQPIQVDGKDKKGLGSEFDLTLTYPIRPYVTVQGGYSVMFGTDAFFVAKGGSKERAQHWGFLSLNVNPAVFKTAF